MSIPMHPGRGQGLQVFVSKQHAAGCASVPCFEARFSESSRHPIYLCNTFSQPRVVTSDNYYKVIIILGHPQGTRRGHICSLTGAQCI